MSESLKRFCPIEIIKGLGNEAIWMFNTAKAARNYAAGITLEDLPEASITYFESEAA